MTDQTAHLKDPAAPGDAELPAVEPAAVCELYRQVLETHRFDGSSNAGVANERATRDQKVDQWLRDGLGLVSTE